MERTIKIEYDPQRSFAIESGAGHTVGRLTDAEVDAIIASKTVIYCSTTGLDTYNGLSEAQAVRTLAKAIELAVTQSKDAVVLLPGFHTYFASHNTFGKTIIAKNGAYLVCLGTDRAYLDSAFQWQKFVFDSQQFAIQKVNPVVPGHNALNGYTSGTGFWFTGRADIPTPATKANRFYMPMLSDGGVLRLARLRLYKAIGASELIETPDATEHEWTAELIPALEVFFAGLGYTAAAFPSGDVYSQLVYNVYDSLRAMGDGLGRVFVVTHVRCALSGGTNYRNVTVIWYNGTPQYFYETPLSPSEGDFGPLSFGNATTPGPMLRQWYMLGDGGYMRHTAIQANKRIGDTGYEYSVTGPAVGANVVGNYAKLPAVYWDGIPMFSTYDDTGKCYSAQQMSNALQDAGGVYANLSTYVRTILESAQRTMAMAKGYQRTAFSVYNRYRASADLVGNINPDSPFMTSQPMLTTDFPTSSKDPHLFNSAAALCDNLFYGGAAINVLWYAEHPLVTKLIAPPYSYGGGDLTLPVHGLGVNCRLQNCEIVGTDLGTQRRAYTMSEPTAFNALYRTRADRIYVEAWLQDQPSGTAPDTTGLTFSNFCRAQTINRFAISTRPSGQARVRNSVFVDAYLIAEKVELWHISAVSCAYACSNNEPIYGSCLAYFTGYYLTPDAAPVRLEYCFIRESLAQNLIPPGSTVTNTQSVDPLFRSVVNPYDLRLQAIAKKDFFDSPALAATPTPSVFGGNREAGAYDQRGIIETTWKSFEIVHPWVMPIETDRVRVTNRRRDGVKTKFSTGKTSVQLRLQWRVALSEDDLRNLERVINADESLVRIYFNPVSTPTTFLTGYVDQSMKHGGPMALLSNVSEQVSIDVDLQQPGESLFDWI